MEPIKGQEFDAFFLSYGTLTKCRHSPFTCTKDKNANIYADDEKEPVAKWAFSKSKFIFKGIK